ncbi:PLDc N-terminal domain-containing protein [Megalodesulfovibrio paquesii]
MNIPLLEWFSTLPPEKRLFYATVLTLPLLANFLAIWHAYQRRFSTPLEKLIWLGIGLLLPFLGGLPYWFIGAWRGCKKSCTPGAPGDAGGSAGSSPTPD